MSNYFIIFILFYFLLINNIKNIYLIILFCKILISITITNYNKGFYNFIIKIKLVYFYSKNLLLILISLSNKYYNVIIIFNKVFFLNFELFF